MSTLKAGLLGSTAKAPEGGLTEKLEMLGRHKTLLTLGAAVGLCAGVAAGFVIAPRYQARVAMQIQNPNADFLNARNVSSVAEASAADSGNLTDVATEIKIMESDQLLDRVIATLRAAGEASALESGAEQLSLVSRLLHRAPPEGDRLGYRLRELVRPNLSIKQVGPTRAVEIVYSAGDPLFAAKFANSFAEQYIEMSEEVRRSRNRHTEESLSQQLEEVRGRLKQSQDALQRYAASSGLVFVDGQRGTAETGDISESKLWQLQLALSQAHADRVQAQSRFEIARAADPESVSDVLADPRLRELSEKLVDLKRQRAELATTYTDENDKVRRVVAQITPLEGEFQKQRSAVLNRIEQDYHMAKRREELLKAGYNSQVFVVESKEGEGVQYSVLRQEVDSNQKLYESVMEQVKRVGIASAVRSDNVVIFDWARPPVMPASPRPTLLAGGGLLVGFLGAACLLVLTDSSGSKLQGAGELQRTLQLRELGVIPASRAPRLLNRSGKDERTPIELTTWSKTNRIADEAYRGLLTSIVYSNDGGPEPRVLVVASVNEGEGKTTTVCNLAVLMAEFNQRVLLIDGDLRRPLLQQVFGVSGRHGLSDLLSNDRPRHAMDFVQPTFVPNLSVLTAGSSGASPVALLHSGALDGVLHQLRSAFDVVLIDTAPSLLTADARILGRSADAVVLVVRAGCTTWDQVETTAKVFAADGTRVLGAVLNDVKPRKAYYQMKTSAAA